MKKNIVFIVFGLILVVVFLWSNLAIPAVNITPSVGTNDFTDSYYPWRDFYSKSIQKGVLPLWSSVLSGGYPALAGPVAVWMLYPLNFITSFFPVLASANLLLVLDYFLIFVFSFLYLRKIHLGQEASFFGSSLITFSGFAVNHILYPDTLVAFYLLMAEFYVLETFLQKNGKGIVWIFLLGLILGLQILGGHPQFIFYGLILFIFYWAIFWFLPAFVVSGKTAKRNYWLFFLHLIIFLGIGLLIGAGQFLPQAEFTLNSTRAAGVSPAMIARYSFPLNALVTFVFPFALFDSGHTLEAFAKNGWPTDERYVYMGIIGLVFFIFSLFFIKKSGKYTLFFILAVLFGVIFSLGNLLAPVAYLQTLPPFSFFRIPFKMMMVVNFSMGVLAALAFEQIWKWLNKGKSMPALKYGILILILGISFFDLKINSEKLHPLVDANKWYKTPEVVSFIKNKLKDQERVTTQYYYYPSIKVYLEKPDLWNNPQTFINYRNLLPAFNALLYDIPMNVSIANAGGVKIARYNELEMEIFFGGIKYADDLSKISVTDSFLFLNRLMGVRYAIFGWPVKNELLSRVYQTNFKTGQNDIYVYEFTDYFPRTFMVPKADKASPQDIKKQLINGDFNPKEKVFIEEDINWGAKGGFAATALFEKYTDQEVIINTQSSGDGFLFLSDNYYPGWKAYVDGKETKILRANYTFRAVPVPEGNHKVIFKFEPESFYLGLKITIISAVITLSLIFILIIVNIVNKVKKEKAV